MIIKALILTTLLTNDPMIVIVPPVEAVEGALFNEYDWEYVIEARRRNSGKGNNKRRRGGRGLR
jgi:hypothetical protein|tara:strand:- start:789 stop:980 length:192 start_codon:yes stop_codon:yes gene_type:complete